MAPALRQLTDGYNATGPSAGEQCVWASVTAVTSGEGSAALARGWDEDAHGPRPVVWSPAASYWVDLAAQEAAALDAPQVMPTDAPSIAQSPLVIAMPLPMAQALGWPDTQVGWADLAALARDPQGWASVGHPEWGVFKLGKMNPHVSTFGLDATVASYYAATGVSSDLTSAQIADPATRQFVQDLESSVVHYGDTSLTFLANMTAAAQQEDGLTYVSAVTLEEKSVLDYNLGNPSGSPDSLAGAQRPAVPLAAVYPSDGTFVSDHPWLTLRADWVSEAQRDASTAMLAWLQQPEQQTVLTDAGFRTFEGVPGGAINQSNGMLPAGAPNVLKPPSAAVLAEVQQSWDELRKRAHVLFVMDTSGSMAELAADGASRLELAKEAATSALDGLAPDDEAGLWAFSWLSSTGIKRELVPIGPAAQTVPAMKASILAMDANGGTPLYATLREAQEAMLADYDPSRINAIVVLSDGANEYPPDNDLAGLVDDLERRSREFSVRVFTIGYSEDADPAALTAIAEASEGHYYEANDPSSLRKVMVSVLSNF